MFSNFYLMSEIGHPKFFVCRGSIDDNLCVINLVTLNFILGYGGNGISFGNEGTERRKQNNSKPTDFKADWL